MADAQNTKLKYKRGTCFGCRKCLYCGVDLQQQKCKCKTTDPPSKRNRTAAVKNAYTRIFNPNWTKNQVDFIQENVSKYNYSINLKKTFNLSLCSRCNSSLLRLTSANAKRSKSSSNSTTITTETFSDLQISQNTQLKSEMYDLTVTEKEFTFQNSLETTLESEFDENSDEENASSMDDDFECEFQYGVFIKLNGKFQPSKWYKVTVSDIDEFLAEIHANVISLTNNESIQASDYHVAFKSEKAIGAGTRLADAQDFQKFRSDYCKFSAKNINMGIFITIKSQENRNKRKKRVIYII